MKDKILIGYYLSDLKQDLKTLNILRNKKNIDKAFEILNGMDISSLYQEILDKLEEQFDESN